MDKFLQYIEAQRRKERLQIQRSTEAIAELDKAERHYLKSGAASASSAPEGANTLFGAVARQVMNYDPKPGRTLKEQILYVLAYHPEGLPSGELLAKLRGLGNPGLLRTTMSPQLSRLRASHEISNSDGRWRIVSKNDEAAGSVDPAASSNSPP